MSQDYDFIVSPHEKDLGGFRVRRILPSVVRRMVGPFIFFDHMGPVEFLPSKGIDVRPHPHIGLATVTYLFEGQIRHQDSLGFDQLIEPGAINWMIAGRGIVHSERMPPELRSSGGRLNGIQLWVALPVEHEDTTPSFRHHSRESLPEFALGENRFKLLLGTVLGHKSPVLVHSDLFYLEARIPRGAQFRLPVSGRESAVYVNSGRIALGKSEIGPYSMAIAKNGNDIELRALDDAHLLFLGGASVGERFIYWNFVSSSRAKIEVAKQAWANGPKNDGLLFRPIPGDQDDFIPLPAASVSL